MKNNFCISSAISFFPFDEKIYVNYPRLCIPYFHLFESIFAFFRSFWKFPLLENEFFELFQGVKKRYRASELTIPFLIASPHAPSLTLPCGSPMREKRFTQNDLFHVFPEIQFLLNNSTALIKIASSPWFPFIYSQALNSLYNMLWAHAFKCL